MHSEKRSGMVPTGIVGLDNVLFGGFLRGGFYLIQGDPGSGKTTLALQFAQRRVRAGERCLYVSLTESRADLERACRSHAWSLEGIDISDLSHVISYAAPESPEVYLHRTGRTGRAGKRGTAISLVSVLFLPETHRRDLRDATAYDTARAQALTGSVATR